MNSPASEWKQWLAENGRGCFLFARGWSNSRQDAEDLVQEAILRMWHHQADKGGGPPDLPLVFSTIRFCGLNHHRSESAAGKREESVIYLNDFQDVWLDPVLEEDEEAMILRDAVQNLSQKLREVVVMKFWGGLTFFANFETLAISPNTAASRYRYALEQLSHELRRIKERNAMQAPDPIEAVLARLMPPALGESCQFEIEEMIDQLTGPEPESTGSIRVVAPRTVRWIAGGGIAAGIGALAAVLSLTREPVEIPLVINEPAGSVLLSESDRIESMTDEGWQEDAYGSALHAVRFNLVEENRMRDRETGMIVQISEPREEILLMPISAF